MHSGGSGTAMVPAGIGASILLLSGGREGEAGRRSSKPPAGQHRPASNGRDDGPWLYDSQQLWHLH
jgi:hypothetical protein